MAHDTDVLIIGAGPTGLTLASELARRGVSHRLVEQSSAPAAQSRALGVQARTLEIFQQMGIAAQCLERGLPVKRLRLMADGRPFARLTFDGLDSPFPFILILPQSETERILAAHLERLGGSVERQVTLTGLAHDRDGVRAELRHANGTTETTQAAWLVGCDGAHSVVRHALGLPFTGASYPEAWMLADAQSNFPSDEVRQFITPQGILGLFPFGGGKVRLIADHPPTPNADPTLEECQAVLDARGPGGLTLNALEWTAGFRIHRRSVSRLQQGCVFLAGDAAHIHSPAGGQGMNTGIQDAFNLAWKLALAALGDASPSLLASYHAERHPVAQAVLRGTDILTRMVTLQNPLLRTARNLAGPLLLNRDAVRHAIRDQVSEIAVGYAGSPIVGEDMHSIQFRSGPAPGERAPMLGPQGWEPTAPDGNTAGRHLLLLFTGPVPSSTDIQTLSQIGDAAQRDYGRHIRIALVTREETPVRTEHEVRDRDGALHWRFAACVPCLYFIRPDGYIGYRSQPPVWEPFKQNLRHTFR